ncbi:ECERIFERUM 1 protein [Nymphaea thermarum]|nr:ECERIFERUM 1 protein [Nymphaea thermarum]
MVVSSGDNISGIRISSVVPAHVTGDNVVHELSALDLAMRLHYVKVVYFFRKDQVQGLDIYQLKKPMFSLLDLYFPVAGRIRKSESPTAAGTGPGPAVPPFYIKCNDGGVRIVEAKCAITLDEWLKSDESSLNCRLVAQQVVGPQIGFSPLVYIQFTTFKCGGLSIGLSWSHILGDAFSASDFMNVWADILAGNSAGEPTLNFSKPEIPTARPLKPSLLPVKPATTVEDRWEIASGETPTEHRSFRFSGQQLRQLRSKVGERFEAFEAIAAVAWKAAAAARGEGSVRRVTVVREDRGVEGAPVIGNGRQSVRGVGIDFDAAGADWGELARAVAEGGADGRKEIERWVEGEGYPEVEMYGGDLTLVDLEGVGCYGLRLGGRGPALVDLYVEGVGKEGVVLVLPGPDDEEEEGGGRVVSVCMPSDQMDSMVRALRSELAV